MLTAALAIVAFSAAGAVFVTDLLSEQERTPRGALIAMGLATALTITTVIHEAVVSGFGALLAAGSVPMLVAAAIALGHLAVVLRYAARGVGAVVAPLCALLMALYVADIGSVSVPSDAMSPVLAVHVGLAVLGLASFALSASVAVLYLLQERQLRNRTFGRLFQRLPSLDALDSASFHLVSVGFIIYTVALVLGVTTAIRTGESFIDARFTIAIVAWAIFGVVIHTRVTSGWRGRQAAWMTVAGCLSTLLVLVFYARP
jgi:ABC-type uncharacterized transport system permease subunit